MNIHRIDDDTIIFNTGVLYRDHGQIIIAKRNTTRLHPSWDCADISRDIHFFVNIDDAGITNDSHLARLITQAYNINAYETLSVLDTLEMIKANHEAWKVVTL